MKVASILIHSLFAAFACDHTVAFVVLRTTTRVSSVQQLLSSYYNSDSNVRLGGASPGVRENYRTKDLDDRLLIDEYQSAPIVPFQQTQQQQQQQKRTMNSEQARPAVPTPARSAGDYYSRTEERQQREQPFSVPSSRSPQERTRGGSSSYRPQSQWWETPSYPHGMMSTDPAGVEVQGSARTMFNTPYQHNTGRQQVYLTTEGRPLDANVELYEGPNNTPTQLRVYSEDGRLRPFRTTVASPPGSNGISLSVRNAGPLEFPISAAVRNTYGGSNNQWNNNNSIMDNNDVRSGNRSARGYQQRTAMPTTECRTVQGGSLKTFTIPESVAAVQVTIVTDGMPMYANVELWGCGGHIKQVAEIYNDNGHSRPFSAIVDTPGGQNTICVKNTGPMAYPIRVSVEPLYEN